jgi:hypothetical protein
MPNDQIDPTKPLHDQQEEAFAVKCAAGIDTFQAYKLIYQKGTKPVAFALREKDSVNARIAFLQEAYVDTMMAEAAKEVAITNYNKEQAMVEAHAALKMSMQLMDARAAVAAVGLKAKLAGLLNESERPIRSLRDLPVGVLQDILKEVRDRQLARLMADEAGDIGAIEGNAATQPH